MSTAARRPTLALRPAPPPEPVVIRERLPAARIVQIALLVAASSLGGVCLGAGLVIGSNLARPSPHPTILEVREDTLLQGQTQLYPDDPAYIVKVIDGSGIIRDMRLTAAGLEALRRWVNQ